MKPLYNSEFAKTRCLEVECPHWGWIKIRFEDVNMRWWNDEYYYDIEMLFKCPACGEEHEILR